MAFLHRGLVIQIRIKTVLISLFHLIKQNITPNDSNKEEYRIPFSQKNVAFAYEELPKRNVVLWSEGHAINAAFSVHYITLPYQIEGGIP